MNDFKEQLRALAEKNKMELNAPKGKSSTEYSKKTGDQKTQKADVVKYRHITEIPEARRAWAPYNFIPLNDHVIPSEESSPFDKYATEQNGSLERHTGYLECEITTKTDTYIR